MIAISKLVNLKDTTEVNGLTINSMESDSFSSKMALTIRVALGQVKHKAKADTFLTTAASMKDKYVIIKQTERGHISIPSKTTNT